MILSYFDIEVDARRKVSILSKKMFKNAVMFYNFSNVESASGFKPIPLHLIQIDFHWNKTTINKKIALSKIARKIMLLT